MNKLPPPLSVIDMYYHFRVLFGDPERYGAATSRVFAIYENFPV
ncbi:DNA-packaging protein [Escherichia coli]|nr:DNA-packaging protein [Escherichia coli]